MKKVYVLGAFILASSGLLSIDKINDYKQFGNVIELTTGNIRLGEVYRESINSTYEVTFVDEKRPWTSVSSTTSELYSSASEDFANTIDSVNKSRKKNKEELLSLDSAKWTADATIKLVTKITYQSEFHPSFVLTIDETTIDHDSENGKLISEYLKDVKSYSNRMIAQYETKHSFIK